MRIHFGVSKFIKPSTILKFLATLFVGAVAFLGLSQHQIAYADTLNSKTPSTFEYYNDYYNTPQIPSIASNDYDYFWYINNPGFNSYNYTFIYNFSSLCPTGFARLSTKFTLSFSDVFYPNSLSFVTTYNNGGTLNASISTEGNFMRLTFPLVDLTKSIKIVMNTTRSELVTRALVNRNWDYTCISDGTSDIIDNASQNTQDIIDNQNQNTQDIIDNQNDNTQAIIDSQKVCKTIDNSSVVQKDKFLQTNFGVYGYGGFGVTDFIPIYENTTIKVIYNSSTFPTNTFGICFYGSGKDSSRISCVSLNSLSSNDFVTIPSGSVYFRSTISNSNYPQFSVCSSSGSVINNSLTDDNTSQATSGGGRYFGDFQINDTTGITSIVTAPIRLLSSMVNNNNSCNSYDFTINLDGRIKQVSLPSGCILWDNVPSSVILIYNTVIFGLMGYRILIDAYHYLSSLRDPDRKNEFYMDL